jgi:hypothetical protein
VEGRVDGAVEGILGCGSVAVEEEACLANLGGEAIGGSRTTRLGLFSGGRRCGEGVAGDQLLERCRCGLFRGDFDIVVIVDRFPLWLYKYKIPQSFRRLRGGSAYLSERV